MMEKYNASHLVTRSSMTNITFTIKEKLNY